MTKEVSIKIEGLQLESEEEIITTMTTGTYHLHENRHYIQYDEALLEEEAITKNMIKITPKRIELAKKGANSSQMIFDLNESTEAIYQTPYGNLVLEIMTTKIILSEEPDKLLVEMEYSLSTNDSHLSDNRITMSITSQK
ncbi:MAG: YwiB family protein [Mobilitalea sp.]